MFHDEKVEELVVVLVAERGVQTPGQRGRLAGLVKVFGWMGWGGRETEKVRLLAGVAARVAEELLYR